MSRQMTSCDHVQLRAGIQDNSDGGGGGGCNNLHLVNSLGKNAWKKTKMENKIVGVGDGGLPLSSPVVWSKQTAIQV